MFINNFLIFPETHGIRVVSKYSRSKAFDTQPEHQNMDDPGLNCGGSSSSKKKDLNNNGKVGTSFKIKHFLIFQNYE